MASANYYVAYIKRRADVTFDDVKKKMDLAYDWFRIGETLWVLYSTSDTEKLYQRLAPLVKDSGSLFICKLDETERIGWMDKEFWKWMDRGKDS